MDVLDAYTSRAHPKCGPTCRLSPWPRRPCPLQPPCCCDPGPGPDRAARVTHAACAPAPACAVSARACAFVHGTVPLSGRCAPAWTLAGQYQWTGRTWCGCNPDQEIVREKQGIRWNIKHMGGQDAHTGKPNVDVTSCPMITWRKA